MTTRDTLTFRRAMWLTLIEDVAIAAGKLALAAHWWNDELQAGDAAKTSVRWGDVMLQAARLHDTWEPWLGLGFHPEQLKATDPAEFLELHLAVVALFSGRPSGLDDDQADAWYRAALERLKKAALAMCRVKD